MDKMCVWDFTDRNDILHDLFFYYIYPRCVHNKDDIEKLHLCNSVQIKVQ